MGFFIAGANKTLGTLREGIGQAANQQLKAVHA
jgi:hypothetical protein